MRPAGGGNYELSLTGVDPDVLFFTERPKRDTGVVPLQVMLGALFRAGSTAPNAALDISGPGAREDVVAFELRKPRYDSSGQTLTYDAKPLDDLDGTQLAYLNDRLEGRPPAQFGEASLFIDETAFGNLCYAQITDTVSTSSLLVTSATKRSTDTWDPRPQSIPPLGTGGWESNGGAFKGCHNTVTFSVQNTDVTVTVDTYDPEIGHNNAECTSSSTSQYTCTLNTSKSVLHGPILYTVWTLTPST
jgi:hypothetical protein